MHFDVGHHMHLHALFKDFPMRVLQSPPRIPVPYMTAGNTKALNR